MKLEKLDNILTYELSNRVIDSLLSSINTIEDHLTWDITKDGNYTTKSAYHFIDHHLDNKDETFHTNFSWILKIKAPDKIKAFIWLFSHYRLPTSQHLSSIGLNINPLCKFCERNLENMNHIFFHCNWATTYWTNVTNHNLTVAKATSTRILIHIRCHPLVGNTYKLNTNGAAPTKPGQGGIGDVIRDHNCNWIIGFVKTCLHTTVVQAEILTIMYLMKEPGITTIKHVYREENRVTDELANEGERRLFLEETTFLDVSPVYAIEVVQADTLGTTFVRRIKLCNINNVGHQMASDHVMGTSQNNISLPP
ncbi:hypothetical protein KY290_033826 [Solanum tuberosum]|uniref:Reverse transcriptase zinc-binding domain-containing protein n=1 Tax=Solanum tuberosum TaxID=4113 RepID=A0ABQ7U2T1_SOLTU|nr:hypothetical protein KY289_033203 [Solanum tuberosum]KAH0647837.1 hypothetical protein KY285_033085 [Solanum tuberosum]KAH0740783.1 hypothetical protein KY290_033826 [Solanum tuberosum]